MSRFASASYGSLGTTMNTRPLPITFLLLTFAVSSAISTAEEEKPETPRIDCVVPKAVQPHEKDPGTIWYDDFVISTRPIGPVVCPMNPTVIKTPYHGPAEAAGWDVELAADYNGKDVVYQSRQLPPGDRVVINVNNGKFVGRLTGQVALSSGKIYFLRVRQSSSDGTVSDWSRWHQGFRVE